MGLHTRARTGTPGSLETYIGTMDDRRDPDAERQTRSLAGLAVVLALAVAALFLVQHLRREGQIEDCLMAGRSNCDALIDR